MSIRTYPDILSQRILVGMILVGRLDVRDIFRSPMRVFAGRSPRARLGRELKYIDNNRNNNDHTKVILMIGNDNKY